MQSVSSSAVSRLPTYWGASGTQTAAGGDASDSGGCDVMAEPSETTNPGAKRGTQAGPTVRLAAVTAENWRDVADLDIGDDQRDLVASNLYSLAEAGFTPLACPRAIYAGPELVGFLMYDLPDTDDPDQVAIYRFMIDWHHQRRGYGKAALELALDEIRAHPAIRTISICYAANNPARVLYEHLGFKEVERDAQGEIVAELSLRPPAT